MISFDYARAKMANHILQYWRDAGKGHLLSPVWNTEKELNLIELAKSLVQKYGIKELAEMLKENKDAANT